MQTVQYFTNCITIEDLTKERNRLAMTHHPDKGGDIRVMQEINAQFESAKKRLNFNGSNYYSTTSNPDFIYDFMRAHQQSVAEKMYNWTGWGYDNPNTNWQRQETPQEKARKERDAREAKHEEEKKEEYLWAIGQIRLAQQQGLLRDCQTTIQLYKSIRVSGQTEKYKSWFIEHGFVFIDGVKVWQFGKRPTSSFKQ